MPLALAGANFAALYVAVLIPALMGGTSWLILVVSGLAVGVQAGQSSAVQVDLLAGRRSAVALVLKTLGLCLAGVLVASASPDDRLVLVAASTVAGGIVGTHVGALANGYLRQGGPRAYQLVLLWRSCYILVLTFVVTVLSWYGWALAILVYFASLAALFLLPGRNKVLTDHSIPARVALLSVLGVAGALVYRNDVNWVRARLAEDPLLLDTWHIPLLAYSIVQGIVGVGVVHSLFARRDAMREWLRGVVLARGSVFTLGWFALFGPLLLMTWSSQPGVHLAIAAVAAVGVGIASGVAHVLGLSAIPYVSGVTLASLLIVALRVMPPIQSLAIYAAALGFVQLGALRAMGTRGRP